MINLSLEAINSNSPYKVVMSNGDYDFVTVDGIPEVERWCALRIKNSR